MSAFDRIQVYSSSAIKGASNGLENLGDNLNKYNLDSPTDVFLAKLEAQGFNMDELRQVLTCTDDQLVVSGAGSGKSTNLIFKVMYDLISGASTCQRQLPDGTYVTVPEKIWVSTFLHSGAEELKQKLGKWQYKLGYSVSNDSIQFSTLHAEFKRALTSMGVQIKLCDNDRFSANSASSLLRRAINSLGILPADRDHLIEDDYQAIEGIVTNYRNRLDETRYEDSNMMLYNLTPTVLDALVETFRQNRLKAGVMDFEDLQELLYKYLYVTPVGALSTVSLTSSPTVNALVPS